MQQLAAKYSVNHHLYKAWRYTDRLAAHVYQPVFVLLASEICEVNAVHDDVIIMLLEFSVGCKTARHGNDVYRDVHVRRDVLSVSPDDRRRTENEYSCQQV